jgi:hypothetical protein
LAPLTWLERARGRRRTLLVLVYVLLGTVVGVLLWRASSLNGLPDVGDPFDAARFSAFRVPVHEDAVPLYKQAVAQLRTSPVSQDYGAMWGVIRGGWSKASPAVRDWVESNRPALALWRQGTARPKAMLIGPGDWASEPRPTWGVDHLMSLTWMALLEGSRLEESGDKAGAWACYNAALRASRHVGMHAPSEHRILGVMMFHATADRLAPWANDPKTDAQTLRRALIDLLEIDALTGPVSETLKADYLMMMSTLEHPDRWMSKDDSRFFVYNHHPWMFRALTFLRREPERSRRVYRILFTHWLTSADVPGPARPKMSESRMVGNESYPDFPYYVAPGKIDAAHPLSPEDLYAWYRSTLLTGYFAFPFTFQVPEYDRERSTRSTLIITFAEQLYEREYGKLPSKPEALVDAGYLKRLPSGYESTPTAAPETILK